MTKASSLPVLIFSIFHGADARSGSNTYFKLANEGKVTCGGTYLQSTTFSIDCNDGICPLGDDVPLVGDVIIETSLPSATASASVSISSYNIGQFDDFNFCEPLSSSDGSVCPSAGAYTLDGLSFPTPSVTTALSIAGIIGISATVTVNILFEGGYTEECSLGVQLVNKKGYTMAYAAAFLLVGFGTAIGIGRKRKVGIIQLEASEGTKSYFEMMPEEDV